MKNAFKRVLSILLIVVVLLGAAPMSGFVGLELPDWLNFDWLDFSTKSSALAATGQCGDNVYWTFDESTGTLTLSGTGDMYNYNYWSDYSPFYSNSNIKTVVIESGVTSIGNSAFCNCTGLTSVTIPNSVTSIGYGAFSGCAGLTSITIPDSVISIGYDAFRGCAGLTRIKIPDRVTSIGNYAFYGCAGLTSITIPDSVTSIGDRAFYGCTGLMSVNIFSIESWCNIIFNFVPDEFFDPKEPYYEEEPGNYPFEQDCSSNPLYYAHFLYLNGEIITDLIIPDSFTSIGDYTFSGCTGLTSITIPDSVTSIGKLAFYGCTGITSLTIPDSVTSIGDSAFCSCTNLINITVSEDNNNYDSRNNCNAIINSKTNELIVGRKNTTIPNSVTSIGDYAFYHCDGITRLMIPDSVTSIGVNAFRGCTGLTNMTIPDSVTSIGDYAFYGCTRLTSIAIPDSVTSIGDGAFMACAGFISVTIPNSVTRIGYRAFSDCSGLKNVYYTGTKKQWNRISIGAYNSPLLNANIIFDSYDFNFSQTHTVDDYQSANAGYKNKYFAGAGVPLDGTNGNPDLCIPGLSAADNFVPQGCGYDPGTGTVLTTGYKNGDTGNSMLFALDGSTGEMTGEYFLSDQNGDVVKSHVGGVAVYNNTIYIASDTGILTYSAGHLGGGNGMRATGFINISDKLNGAKCSYVTISDGVLWTGNFYDADDELYNLNANPTFNSVILGFDLKKNSDFSKADYTVWVDNKIENIQSAVSYNGTWYITTSYGRQNDSILYFGKSHSQNYIYSTELTPVTALPMMENGFIKDGYLYAAFESAAWKYNGAEDTVSRNPTDVIWKINLEQMQRNTFVIGKDSNGFIHNNEQGDGFEGSKNYKISDQYFNLLTRNSNAVEKTYVKAVMAEKWGGSCYGVSATMAMLKNKQITLSDLTNKSVPDYFSIGRPCDDAKFRDVINYYQLSQCVGKGGERDSTISKFYPGTLDAVNLVTGNSIKDTLRKIVDCANENKLYVLTFSQLFSGHALLLVDCAYINGEYVVRYFDLNSENCFTSFNSTEYNYMYIKKDFSHYTLSDLSFMYDTAVVNLVDPAKMISLNPYSAKSYAPANTRAAAEPHTKFYIVPDRAFTLTNAEGQTLSFDGENFSGDMAVYDLNTIVRDTDCEYVFEIDSSAEFTLDCAGEIDCSLGSDDTYFSVSGDNISGVTFTQDAMKLSGSNMTFKAFASTDEQVAENELGLVSVSASADGDVTLTKNNDKIEVSSDGKMKDIEASSYTGTEEQTQTYDGTTDELTLTTDEDVILINKQVRSVDIRDISLNYKKSATLKPQITADEGVTYTVKYESSNPKIAAVDQNGKVTATKRGSGTATITCTVTDQYGNVVKDTCTVSVSLSFVQKFIVYILFGWIWY